MQLKKIGRGTLLSLKKRSVTALLLILLVAPVLTFAQDPSGAATGGIKDMGGLPDALFIIDVGYHKIAITEARKLGIPVVAVVDTNCDPDIIQYVIPGNDDAIRAIKLFTAKIADACVVGARVGRERAAAQTRDEAPHAGDRKPAAAAPGAPAPRVEMRKNRGGLRGTPAAAATPTSVMLSSEEE